MVPDNSPWIARANHGWIARVQLAAWVLPAGLMLQTVLVLLEIVCHWAAISYQWEWPVYVAAYAARSTPYLPALVIVALWFLTAPEARPQTTSQPAPTRLWARWLTIVACLMPLAFTFLPSLWTGDGYVTQRFVDTIALVCLLLLMRNYSLRCHDAAAGKLLRRIAILGAAAALSGLLGAVLLWSWAPTQPSWAMFVLAPIAVTALAFGFGQLWAMIRFAVGFQRAVRSQRPQVRLVPVLWFTLGAIVLGGLAGAAAETMFLTQVKRADADWTDLLQQLYELLTPLSIIIAAATLPHPLHKLFRSYTRH